MKVIAVIALLVFPAAAEAQIAEPQTKHPRHSFNGRHDGCNTHKCDRRMDKKAHAKTLGRWWSAVKPFNTRLERMAGCESGGRWHIATGNGFFGGLQFTVQSWYAAGGHGMPHWAEPMEQKFRAVILSRLQGWGAWPVCQFA